jgi:hypothetical protein
MSTGETPIAIAHKADFRETRRPGKKGIWTERSLAGWLASSKTEKGNNFIV